MDDRRFLKPPSTNVTEERIESKLQCDRDTNLLVTFNPHLKDSISSQREKLPIFLLKGRLLYNLEKHQTVIVVGETGCGKSTQIPQYLFENGWSENKKEIYITQPRRIAAVTLAARIATEMGCKLGETVGYNIRFDSCFSSGTTKICFVTDGLLLMLLSQDPLLEKCSVLIIDEAHERSLNTDLLFGLVKRLLLRRPDLRLIISSATLEAEKMREYFTFKSVERSNISGKSTILSVSGRQHDVQIWYSKLPVPDYVTATVDTILYLHTSEIGRNTFSGDILAFLTGADEIMRAINILKDRLDDPKHSKRKRLQAFPLFAGLPAREQIRAMQRLPQNLRKVVISTNIAEASLTIDNIEFVVDCGFVKERRLNLKLGIDSLSIVPTSQASATQRAGRAGRVRAGHCFRLYPESEWKNLPASTLPEIQRCDLSSSLLLLKSLGVDNIARFDYLSPPPVSIFSCALERLYALGAIDQNVFLNKPFGQHLALLSLLPTWGKSLLQSNEFNCTEEMLTLASLLQVEGIWVQPTKATSKQLALRARHKFSVSEGDHMTLLNLWKAYCSSNCSSEWCRQHWVSSRAMERAGHIRDQLSRTLKVISPYTSRKEASHSDNILRSLIVGFFAQVAKYDSKGFYRTPLNDSELYPLYIHPSSVLYTLPPPSWVIFTDSVQTDKLYMRDVSCIKPYWLTELAPHFYCEE